MKEAADNLNGYTKESKNMLKIISFSCKEGIGGKTILSICVLHDHPVMLWPKKKSSTDVMSWIFA